ncbi:MAG: hypothetical protein IPK82_17360 [Polyangiaceae bacterium]|nr:hypothetical protein [Polyangiaceae bacterium]
MNRRSFASRHFCYVAVLAAAGALSLGCTGTRVISGGPFSGAVTTQEGTLRYSLSKSVVTVEATVTRGASGRVTFDGNDFVVDTKVVRKDARAEVTIGSMADEDQFFTLRLEHGNSDDDSLSVEIAPNGVLRSIGVTNTSQLGNTVKNVATIVGSVAASIALATLGSDPKKLAAALVCEKLASDAGTPGRCTLETPVRTPAPVAPTTPTTRTKGDATPPPTTTPPPATKPGCDKRTETSLAELSMANLYFLARSPKNRRLWQERRDVEGRLTDRTCRRTEVEHQLERTTGTNADDLKSRLAVLIDLENAARRDLRTASEELDAAVRAFQLETGIDGPTRTETVRMTFDLNEIPPPDILRRAARPEPPERRFGMTDTETRAALQAYPRVLELFDRTGMALTITPPPYIARGGTLWEGSPTGEVKTHIYYRPAYTAVLTTYATQRAIDEQGGETELLRFFSVTSDEVIHPKMPVLGFAFDPVDFGERKISLGFDEKGRLVRFEQSGKSSALNASGAAADAVRNARDEYAATLSRIAEIQNTERQLQQNDVITEIDRLKKQRELLDARLELSGTRGNYDLLLERKRLDAQLAVIQGRRALAGEQNGASVSQEITELRSKLEQLARDLEDLKHRDGGRPITGGR